ncbi:prolipoprotein diacylglyceryl transferase [Mycolicibacterium canariasense]|uniref:Phosphatidylglycerol--prolipoprotein diacylglyceryl transferase n=1 Tax=Mycolicibacterium canariasense TaxID=228230 RepID=A0A124E295_MYCCR|nr:prolipoprotein diacylglyceryl transferase [Mycolicibacterium canariasense]MCV7207823.1 prolipoprotein diacylglyceryl transferase [Mycolicibacterium canariasense]ORV04879.1 prolipoprotein diacylglyceryl transferase [Mycolicibacterium canariasense]GAS96110.1 prolipoprotein diacylglyceryl transferase [Mycolicibacterium canariasense]
MTETILAYIPSPAQGVWHIGPVPIRAYALCIIAGIVAALVIGDRRWAARGGEPGVIYDIALLAVPFGLVGGRLYHVMTDWKTYFGDGGAGLGAAFRIWDGGLGIWGAVALGAVGAWIGCRMRGVPLPAFGDAIAPGIILAQAIGRLGNYFNQELYGRETTVPWGLEIYERRDASGALNTLNGVSDGQLVAVVHPTFLYELLWNLLIFALLLWIDKRFNIGHGRLFALYVAGYCVGRFWVELMRSDPASMPVDGIRVNTFTSTFVFIAAVVYVMVAPKGREAPETLRGKQDADAESPVDDILAKELATVGATTGVVAAATVAGDAEDEDAAAVGDTEAEDAAAEDVAAEAEAADEAEEPVDAGTLEVAGEPVEESIEDSSEGESDPFDIGHELEVAAESLAAEREAESHEADAADEGEPAAEDSVEEPGEEPAEDAVEEAEAIDAAEGEAEEPVEEESEPFDIGHELEAAAESLAADHDGGEDEEGEAQPAADEGADEADTPAEAEVAVEDESADTPADPAAEVEAEAEAAEDDSPEEEPADAKSEPAVETPAAVEPPRRTPRWWRRNND